MVLLVIVFLNIYLVSVNRFKVQLTYLFICGAKTGRPALGFWGKALVKCRQTSWLNFFCNTEKKELIITVIKWTHANKLVWANQIAVMTGNSAQTKS